MTIRFETDIDSHMAFYEHLIRTDSSLRRDRAMIRLLIPAMIIAMFIIAYIEEPSILINWTLLIIFVAMTIGLWIVFTPWNYRRVYLKKAKRRLRESEGFSDNINMELTFDDEHLHIITSHGEEAQAKWDSIAKIDETEKCFFIYRSSIQALTIPKGMITAEEVESVRSMLKKHINNYYTFK